MHWTESWLYYLSELTKEVLDCSQFGLWPGYFNFFSLRNCLRHLGFQRDGTLDARMYAILNRRVKVRIGTFLLDFTTIYGV